MYRASAAGGKQRIVSGKEVKGNGKDAEDGL